MFHIVLPSLKEGLTANCKHAQTGKAERKFNWRWGGGGGRVKMQAPKLTVGASMGVRRHISIEN